MRTALRAAATSTPGVAGRPGQLRVRLEAQLGSSAESMRPWVHRIVAAAEEHVPGKLSAAAPVTRGVRDRVAGELALARGWSPEAAGWAVSVWAQALGLTSEASISPSNTTAS